MDIKEAVAKLCAEADNANERVRAVLQSLANLGTHPAAAEDIAIRALEAAMLSARAIAFGCAAIIIAKEASKP